MHKHSYSLFVTVERLLPELGTPKVFYKCACGSELSSVEGLVIINAAQQSVQADGATVEDQVTQMLNECIVKLQSIPTPRR